MGGLRGGRTRNEANLVPPPRDLWPPGGTWARRRRSSDQAPDRGLSPRFSGTPGNPWCPSCVRVLSDTRPNRRQRKAPLDRPKPLSFGPPGESSAGKNGGGGGSRTPVRSARTSRFSTLSPDLFFSRRVFRSGRPGAEANLKLSGRLFRWRRRPQSGFRVKRRGAPDRLPGARLGLIRPRERGRWCWQLVFDRRFYERTAVLGVLLDR